MQLIYDNKPMQSIKIHFLDIDMKAIDLEFDISKKLKLPKCSMTAFIPYFFDFKKVTKITVQKDGDSVKIEFQITDPNTGVGDIARDLEVIMEFSFIIPSDETEIKIYPLAMTK